MLPQSRAAASTAVLWKEIRPRRTFSELVNMPHSEDDRRHEDKEDVFSTGSVASWESSLICRPAPGHLATTNISKTAKLAAVLNKKLQSMMQQRPGGSKLEITSRVILLPEAKLANQSSFLNVSQMGAETASSSFPQLTSSAVAGSTQRWIHAPQSAVLWWIWFDVFLII